jgi:hypothetical protein
VPLPPPPAPALSNRSVVGIGGGKDCGGQNARNKDLCVEREQQFHELELCVRYLTFMGELRFLVGKTNQNKQA